MKRQEFKAKQKQIVDWLKACDPSTNHNAARKTCEPGTGSWFIDSSEFVDWRDNHNHSLWLQGIPGAGKTILCSTIIDELKIFCTARPQYRCAYFYFDFADKNKQIVDNFLRSIIVQLFHDREDIPEGVQSLYDAYKDTQPTRNAMIEALSSLLRLFSRTYILVDALDECCERGEIVKFLKQLIVSPNSINLLITSRMEQDIITELQSHIEVVKCIENAKVDADIKMYVHKYLTEDPTLKCCRPVMEEVTNALFQGAKGMYISVVTLANGL